MAKDQKVPKPVISRLTRYFTWSQEQLQDGKEWTSSQELAEQLSINGATIRRDLTHLDIQGVTNKGYNTRQLCAVLDAFLGANRNWKVVVVGAGNLGKALTLHGDLARQGFRICAILDTDGRKVGATIGHLTVRHLDELPGIVEQHDVSIGVVAVPSEAAQSVADMMVVSGIRGIFNLSLKHLIVPEWVQISDGRLVAGMLELAYAVKEHLPDTRRDTIRL